MKYNDNYFNIIIYFIKQYKSYYIYYINKKNITHIINNYLFHSGIIINNPFSINDFKHKIIRVFSTRISIDSIHFIFIDIININYYNFY